MKLKLEPPFNTRWRIGYLQNHPDGRRRVYLFNSNDDRTTISYARYLVSVREGRFLSIDEEVDHNDRNKSNDDLSNLVLRSVKDHRAKTAAEGPQQTFLSFVCPVCHKPFQRRKGLEGKNRIPKCSRRCNGLASQRIQMLRSR